MSEIVKKVPVWEQVSALVTPDWRWKRVLSLCQSSTPSRCSVSDDAWVRGGRTFFPVYHFATAAKREAERRQLFATNPDLFLAVEIGANPDQSPSGPYANASFLAARILANQEPERIQENCGLTTEAVRWYEKLFFDVRPRLEQRDWILSRVLIPAIEREACRRPGLWSKPAAAFLSGAILLVFGYYGGPVAVDAAVGISRTTSGDQQKLVEFLGTSVVRRSIRAVLTAPVNKYNLTGLIESAARFAELANENVQTESSASDKQVLIAKLLYTECSGRADENGVTGGIVQVEDERKGRQKGPPLRLVPELSGTPSAEPRDYELEKVGTGHG